MMLKQLLELQGSIQNALVNPMSGNIQQARTSNIHGPALTPGLFENWNLKFEASCKFNHPKNAGESMSHVPLNIYPAAATPTPSAPQFYPLVQHQW
ncbi:hypothetical protein Bca52824_003153 [Brassica carinata]|uniref:Uncharacterized protein n=1 Tax=Brassica carinata TaxID=52824 RepID=A0A8X8BEY8_BRACI|nr:hypothetical protein Bca52824_003153 [Brassica carinata]